jgi:hypothetical protein
MWESSGLKNAKDISHSFGYEFEAQGTKNKMENNSLTSAPFSLCLHNAYRRVSAIAQACCYYTHGFWYVYLNVALLIV